ncbi:MAG: lysophospholipase [Candidatus Omnitrophica bacterium]|nr:lysophospholipase [Candidatus Omnitrophota bacterium]
MNGSRMISSNEGEGSRIIYRRWETPSSKAIILLVHGLGAHSGRWEFLADFFLKNNISSYALELKGFGETEGLRGHIDSFNIYFDDIRSLYNIIKKENPHQKVFLLGESMGAIISFLTAIYEPGLFDGLICISPAFQSRLELAPFDYIKIFLPLFYNPKKQFDMPFTSEMCTRDIDYQKVMDSDKREHRLATSKLLFGIAVAQARAYLLRGRLKIPVLFLIAGEDKLVDPGASTNVFKGLKAKDRTLIPYPGMYHALSIDIGREIVFEDILKWLEPRI